jgi:hypothetical protein
MGNVRWDRTQFHTCRFGKVGIGYFLRTEVSTGENVKCTKFEEAYRAPRNGEGEYFITPRNQKRFSTHLFFPRFLERPVQAPLSGSLRKFPRGLGKCSRPFSVDPRRVHAPPAMSALSPIPAP